MRASCEPRFGTHARADRSPRSRLPAEGSGTRDGERTEEEGPGKVTRLGGRLVPSDSYSRRCCPSATPITHAAYLQHTRCRAVSEPCPSCEGTACMSRGHLPLLVARPVHFDPIAHLRRHFEEAAPACHGVVCSTVAAGATHAAGVGQHPRRSRRCWGRAWVLGRSIPVEARGGTRKTTRHRTSPHHATPSSGAGGRAGGIVLVLVRP